MAHSTSVEMQPSDDSLESCVTDARRDVKRARRKYRVVVEERVQGGATGLRCDRAPLRLAPEEAARREPATAAPAGLCIARSAPRLLSTRLGDRSTHVQAHCRREGVSMRLSRGAEARDGCEGDTIGRTSRDESPGRRLPYGLSSAPRPWLSWWTVTVRVR